MTLEDLQTKRDEILASIGHARITFGERSLEYSRQQEALALVDAEIARLQSPQPKQFTIQTSRGF